MRQTYGFKYNMITSMLWLINHPEVNVNQILLLQTSLVMEGDVK